MGLTNDDLNGNQLTPRSVGVHVESIVAIKFQFCRGQVDQIADVSLVVLDEHLSELLNRCS